MYNSHITYFYKGKANFRNQSKCVTIRIYKHIFLYFDCVANALAENKINHSKMRALCAFPLNRNGHRNCKTYFIQHFILTLGKRELSQGKQFGDKGLLSKVHLRARKNLIKMLAVYSAFGFQNKCVTNATIKHYF